MKTYDKVNNRNEHYTRRDVLKGLANSPRDIAQSCPQATLVGGFAVLGSHAAKAQDDVLAWLQENNFLNR